VLKYYIKIQSNVKVVKMSVLINLQVLQLTRY